jgi:DNA polymerase III subunit delta'
MLFAEVIGQEDVKNKLRGSVLAGRIPHAQLFAGQEGTGALPLALAYAQYISCLNRNELDSCGVCSSCAKYGKFSHPDLRFSYPYIRTAEKEENATEFIKAWITALQTNPYLGYFDWLKFMDAGNKQGNIPISECRAIIRSLALKPFESEFKVLLMWLPEFLDQEGNVLLKIIEEPPHKTLFLLVSENTERILSTIRSRTQLVRIPPIAAEDLKIALMQRHELDEARATEIANLSEGSYRRAEELLELGANEMLGPFREWLISCFKGSRFEQQHFVSRFAEKGREELRAFFGFGLYIMRMCLAYPFLGDNIKLAGAEKSFVEKLSAQLSPARIESMYHLLNDAIYHTERNGNAKMILTDLSIHLEGIFRNSN